MPSTKTASIGGWSKVEITALFAEQWGHRQVLMPPQHLHLQQIQKHHKVRLFSSQACRSTRYPISIVMHLRLVSSFIRFLSVILIPPIHPAYPQVPIIIASRFFLQISHFLNTCPIPAHSVTFRTGPIAFHALFCIQV